MKVKVSDKEKQILELMAAGLSIDDIAIEMGYSANYLRAGNEGNIMRGLYDKFHIPEWVNNGNRRTYIVAVAFRQGILR